MSLFNLIKEHYRVRFSSYLFGKLSALFKAYISRRRTDKFRHRVLLHIFTHIKSEHCIFVAEHCLSKSLAQFGFTDTGRSEEYKRADRTLRVFKSNPATANCLGNCRNCFILTDYSFVKDFLHIQQTFAFLFGKLNNRYTCPIRNYLSNNFGCNLAGISFLVILPLFSCLIKLSLNLFLFITKFCGTLKILFVDCAFLFLVIIGNLVFKLLDITRRCKRSKSYL